MGREKKKLEESLKKTTEEALDAMEKMIIQESLKKKTSENIVTIKDSVKISKTCWNCFDDKCRSHMTNLKQKRKKLKNKNEIEKAITTETVLSAAEKALLLESMSEYNENNKNTQQTPPKSTSQKKELNISLVKHEISETIENESIMSEEEAMKILELMKNNQEGGFR